MAQPLTADDRACIRDVLLDVARMELVISISRLLSDHLDKLALVLAHAGLKVVPTEYQCVDPRTAQAMATLYEAALRKVGNHVELLWDEPDEPP